MSPARNPRSVVHPPWLAVKWWGVGVVGFVLLCSASAFPNEFLPLAWVLFMVWVGARGERDSGCPLTLRKEKR